MLSVRRQRYSSGEIQSGWRDSNPRPSVPQTDALTKLRHSPLCLVLLANDDDTGDASRTIKVD